MHGHVEHSLATIDPKMPIVLALGRQAQSTRAAGLEGDDISEHPAIVLLGWNGSEPAAIRRDVIEMLDRLRDSLLAEQPDAYRLPSPVAAPALPSTSVTDTRLSEREVEVLRLVATGLSNAQVADQLYLSPRTIEAHLHRIYRKLKVHTRAAAVRVAVMQGLV